MEATLTWPDGGPPQLGEDTKARVTDPGLPKATKIPPEDSLPSAPRNDFETCSEFKKHVNLEGTNSTNALESIKISKTELKTNFKRPRKTYFQ